jgi:hypothetical protein
VVLCSVFLGGVKNITIIAGCPVGVDNNVFCLEF